MCCAGLSRTSNLILHISLAFILYISYISSCAGSHTHAHPFEYMRAYITRVCRCTSCVCGNCRVQSSRTPAWARTFCWCTHALHYTLDALESELSGAHIWPFRCNTLEHRDGGRERATVAASGSAYGATEYASASRDYHITAYSPRMPRGRDTGKCKGASTRPSHTL